MNLFNFEEGIFMNNLRDDLHILECKLKELENGLYEVQRIITGIKEKEYSDSISREVLQRTLQDILPDMIEKCINDIKNPEVESNNIGKTNNSTILKNNITIGSGNNMFRREGSTFTKININENAPKQAIKPSEEDNREQNLFVEFIEDYKKGILPDDKFEYLGLSSESERRLADLPRTEDSIKVVGNMKDIKLVRKEPSQALYRCYPVPNNKDLFFLIPKEPFQANLIKLITSAFAVFFKFDQLILGGSLSVIKPAVLKFNGLEYELAVSTDKEVKNSKYKGEVTF